MIGEFFLLYFAKERKNVSEKKYDYIQKRRNALAPPSRTGDEERSETPAAAMATAQAGNRVNNASAAAAAAAAANGAETAEAAAVGETTTILRH